MNEITRETFDSTHEIETKLSLLFDICDSTRHAVERLEKSDRKRTVINGACSTIGGIAGGISAFLGLKIFRS